MRVPILATGPYVANDPALLDASIRTLARLGYSAIRLDRQHGRFSVQPHSDPFGDVRFDVQCYSRGLVSVTPGGPEIEPDADGAVMISKRLRAEYVQVTSSLGRGLAELTQ